MATDLDEDTRAGLGEAEQQRLRQLAADDAADAEREQLESFWRQPSAKSDTGGPGGIKNRIEKLKSFAKKHKKKLLFAGPFAGFGLVMLALALFLAASLAVPHFVQNTVAHRLAGAARTFRQANDQIMSKKIAIETMSDSQLRQVANAGGRNADLLNKWRIGAITRNLQTTEMLTPKYEIRKDPEMQAKYGSKLVAITFKDEDGRKQTIPASELRKIGESFGSRERLSVRINKKFSAVLAIATRSESISSTLLRTEIGKNIFPGLKKFYAWSNKGKDYSRLSKQDADRKILREINTRAVGAGISARPSLDANGRAVDTVQQDMKKSLVDDAKSTEIVQNGRPAESTLKLLAESTDSGGAFDTVTRAVSSVVNVTATACAIVDGSVVNSKEVTDKKIEGSIQQAGFMASAAAQQISGELTPEARGALERKVNGDGSLVRASTLNSTSAARPIDTVGNYSSAIDDYTILNVMFEQFGGDPESGVVNGLNSVCSIAGDWKFAATAAVAETAATFWTGGGGKVAAKFGADAVAAAAKTYMQDLGRSLLTKDSAKRLVTRGGIEAGLTLLARQQVASYSNMYYSGLSNNLTFAEETVAGFNALNNEESRAMGGAPMTGAEADQTYNSNIKLDKQISSSAMGPYERYFALTNPQSLLTKVSFSILGSMQTPWATKLLSSGSSLFNPLAIGGLFSKLSPSVSAAEAGNPSNPNSYTRTDIGWTDAEFTLIERDPSYYDIDWNECLLDGGDYNTVTFECKNGSDAKRQELEEKYGKCWSETMGELFASGAIVRNDDGTPVPGKGDCSPQNLGPNNPEEGDLVFRLRISKMITAGLTIGAEITNPQPDETNGASITASDGSMVWPMPKSSQISDCYGSQTKHHPRPHAGIDMWGPDGSEIVAAGDGKVVRAGQATGYGNHFVIIKHTNGMGSSYGHMRAMHVTLGMDVKAGQVIGIQGTEGWDSRGNSTSTGDHLHFNIFPGDYKGSDRANVNPLKYVTIPDSTKNPDNCSAAATKNF